MASITLIVGDEYVALTDGTNNAFAHCVRGTAKYTIADTKPDADAPAFPINDPMQIYSPMKVWVKSASRSKATFTLYNY